MFVAVMLCIFVVGLSYADVVVVDDHFDDNVVTTNTTGIGSGFNSWDIGAGGNVTEADSKVKLNGPTHGGSRCSIASKEGAAIGSGTSRFEFRGVSFAVGNESTGGTARDCIGVKEGNAAWDYDGGLPTGFWIEFEGVSLTTADGTGTWNGTSVLFYESSADVKTVLATWSFDTLNWDSGTRDLTPVLDITLDLTGTSYSLTIEGDTITLLSGSLAGTFTFSNELTVGYATAYIQSEKPGIDILIDQIILAENVTTGGTSPYDPAALPQNPDGTVGNLDGLDVTNVELTFKAGADPNYPDNGSIVHSDTAGFVIRLQTGAPADPNLYNVGTIDGKGSPTDPNRTFSVPGVLQDDTTYKWQVEQVLNDPNGNPYPAGNPNNISGGVWSFTTISAVPSITDDPDHTLTDLSGNAELTITATTSATDYRWFKEAGETDIKLTDGGIYSDTTTATLKIAGMASNGSEDAQYYAIAYNGDPEGAGLASAPSATAWVWYPREVHRYTFESITTDGGNSFVEDTIGTSAIQLISGDSGLDLASIVEDNPAAPGLVGTHSLYLNNPNANPSDPNNADGQYGQINDTMVGAYADITISAWIYHKGGGWQRILSFGNNNGEGTGAANGEYMYLTSSGYGTDGQLMLNIHDQAVAAPAGGYVPVNEWAYVTATLSGDTAKLFVNGEWIATNAKFTADPIANAPTANNWIGRSQWYVWDTLFNGYIADLRIWNYGLSTDEVGKAYMADTNAAYVCDTEVYNLSYDFNDDCIINLADFAMLAQAWLDSDRIYPPTP